MMLVTHCSPPHPQPTVACMSEGLSGRIRLAREQKGLSQEAAAHAAGVALMTWSRWETGGIKTLRSNNLQAVAKVLGVTEAWLLKGESVSGETTSTPLPAGWIELVQRRPELVAKFTAEEQAEIRAFAARYHRARSWTDFETVLLRISDARPSAIFEEKKRKGE